MNFFRKEKSKETKEQQFGKASTLRHMLSKLVLSTKYRQHINLPFYFCQHKKSKVSLLREIQNLESFTLMVW